MKTTTKLLAAATLAIAGCSQTGIKGDGVIKTEARVISDFSTLVVTGGYDVKWSGGKPTLTITTDQNLVPLINSTVSGGTLTIDSKDNLAPTKGIEITLSGSPLTRVNLTGGSRIAARGISGDTLKLESTGAADITVDGAVTNLQASMTGASSLDGKSLKTQNATLSLTGACDAQVNVTGTLKASITGAGSVTYAGNPKSVERNITGAGSIGPQQ